MANMEIRTMGILFLLLFSILVSWPMHSDGRFMAGESLNDMVEHILLDCGLDPKLIPALNKFDFASPDSIILDSTQCKRKLCMNLESWELKKRVFNCLIKHDFRETRVDKTQNGFTKVPASFYNLRRNLADIPVPTIPPPHAPIPAPTLSPVPAPILAPSVSPGPALFMAPALALSPAPILAPALALGPAPILAPSSSPSLGPALKTPSPAPTPLYIENADVVSSSPTPTSKSLQIPEDPRSHDNNSRGKKSDVAVIVLSVSAAALIIVFLIFCCCRCARNRSGPEIGRKDERPLLTLSWSDFFGSPYSSGFSSSVQKEKINYSSVKTESGMNGHIFTNNDMGKSPAPESNANIMPHLKPPPGRPMASSPTPPAPSPPPSIPKPVPPPPPLPKAKPSPPPPPPPESAASPSPAQASYNSRVPRPSPLGPNRLSNTDADGAAPKTKLKPLFWDKVSPNPEKSMVWNEIKSGSFQFNEEMIETLFGYNSDIKRKTGGKNGTPSKDPAQLIQLLDSKKSQNLAISLKALSIKVDDVVDALMEGNELPQELLQSLLRMAPTSDEELKIRLYSGDLSLLGPGEQFLKAIIDIPYAFKRMETLLFIFSLPEDISSIKQSFSSLEVACKELKSSRLFLKLLEAVLKLGNRMNDGTFRGGAQAFKLDTLLKLSDVKGVDGKTTLLHFVVQEIIKSEGARAIRLGKETNDSSQESIGLSIVSSLSSELDNVKKAAALDAEALTTNLSSLDHKLTKTEAFLNTEMKSSDEDSGFHQLLKSFVEHAQVDINSLLEEEKRIKVLVKGTADYFHGNSGRDEGLRLFVIVRDFLNMIDKACKEVSESAKVTAKVQKNNNLLTNVENRQHLFPAIRDQRVDSSSSDEEKS